MADEILLESGTNEVEILEFYLGDQSYGINVAKVLQIELFEPEHVTRTPDAGQDGYLGVYLWRGETVPLLDLCLVLGMPKTESVARPLVVVTEFNRVKNAFLVDGVRQVYRVGWERMEPVSSFLGNYSSRVNATLHVESDLDGEKENVEILMLDFESIVAEYCPDTNLGYQHVDLPPVVEEGQRGRDSVNIIMAEDSNFLREIMARLLREAGYTNLKQFENGQEAFNYVSGIKSQIASGAVRLSDALGAVISDIEMPLMDGLTLCRKIKQELGLAELPVIFFSSLINEQMMLKCKEVGGDAQITKPELGKLVSLLDEFCLKAKA